MEITKTELRRREDAYQRALARAEQLYRKRNEGISAALAAGKRQTWIAEVTGLTPGRINQLVKAAR